MCKTLASLTFYLWESIACYLFFLKQNLRQTLNELGLGHVMIIGGDSETVANEMIVRDILHDAELYKAVDIVGFVSINFTLTCIKIKRVVCKSNLSTTES